jgi:hypothetical protein
MACTGGINPASYLSCLLVGLVIVSLRRVAGLGPEQGAFTGRGRLSGVLGLAPTLTRPFLLVKGKLFLAYGQDWDFLHTIIFLLLLLLLFMHN